jgi:hypothetical protein
MELEARLTGNDCAPMAETDQASWKRCLSIALHLFETNVKKAQDEADAKAEAATKAAAEAALSTLSRLNPPIPGSSTKRPAVCLSSGYPVCH